MAEAERAKFKLNNSELWGGLVGLALGVFVVWSGYKLKIGGIHDPGSGFVVFYTGILMCLFAVSIIVAAVTEGGPTIGSLWAGTRWTKPLIVTGCLTLFAFLLQPFGFLLSAIPLPNPRVEKTRVAISYDYRTAGVDYHKGTQHLVDGTHYVLATEDEFARWTHADGAQNA